METKKAPINHASSENIYGVATSGNYGHVKVTTGNGLNNNGGTLNGNTCTVTTSSSYAATATTKPVTTYEYKWSTDETIKGWVKTGETRAINA